MVVIAVGGVGAYQWHEARGRADVLAEQDAAWSSAAASVATSGGLSEVGADGSYLVIASELGGPCTAAESAATWQTYVDTTADAIGYQPSEEFMALNGITRLMATQQCNELKTATFARSVTAMLDDASDVFASLGVSDAAVAELKSMRGLDGSQERTEDATAAGPLTLTFQYDGANGAQVRVERVG